MNFTLSIDLVGADKAEDILKRLSRLSKGLGSGGSIFVPSGMSSAISKQTEDIRRLTSQVEKGKVGVHALGKELKNLGESPGVRMFSKAGGSQGSFPLSASALARNPQLAEMLRGSNVAQSMNAAGGKYRGVYWSSKAMQLMQFPPMPSWLENISPGISKVAQQDSHVGMFRDWIKTHTTTGLRDVTGKDLAKVMGLPDINEYSKKTDWKKAALGGVAGLFNPWMGSRILSDVFAGAGGGGHGGGTAKGIFGAGGAMGFAEFYLAFSAFKKAMELLRYVVQKTAEAFENARKIYAKALTGGMGVPFTVKRSLMAEIMGVSETDVFRFGAQMNYLNQRLEMATGILAKTTVPMTQVSYEWKIMEAELSATWATIANHATPAVLALVGALDELVKMFNFVADSKLFKIALMSLNPLIPIFDLIGKMKQQNQPMPTPQAWMKQLPASHWEHMGLVLGGGTQNYARETAHNTRQIAKDIATMAKNMGIGKGRGMSFGMAAYVNNP